MVLGRNTTSHAFTRAGPHCDEVGHVGFARRVLRVGLVGDVRDFGSPQSIAGAAISAVDSAATVPPCSTKPSVALKLDGKAYEQITQHYAARAFKSVNKAATAAKDAPGLQDFLTAAGAGEVFA